MQLTAETGRMKELVGLFESHGALADPELLERLAAEDDGAVRAQAILGGMEEIPFHFDVEMWERLEERDRESVSELPSTPASPEVLARKAALRRKAAAIYDGSGAQIVDAGDDAEGDGADPDDGDDADGQSGADGAPAAPPGHKQFRVDPRSDWQPFAANVEGELEIGGDMTGNSTCEGNMGDFVSYFRDRYDQIAKFLRQRRELRNAVPIERVRAGQQEVQLIGMVVDKGITKNGHRRVELEDASGAITCLVREDEKQLCAFADTLVTDEVIGLVGQASSKGDLIFIDSMVRPDIPRPDPNRERGADVPVMAAFLSDIHVGSNTFLEENWKAVLEWLSGHGKSKREQELAGRIKYLVIPGDLVDGVGIYPGQQDELTIGDVYDQYGAFGDWMENLPEHLDIVVQPGNHDASRPAEPQPAFAQEVRNRFDHHNAKFVSNPATFSMHGVSTLGYHGSSLIDFATSCAHLEYEEPLPAMEQMLKSRHLAPLYGERTPVAPEHHDYLVINEVPDLFVTGHVHVPGIRNYRGVQMINSGTWQSQTLYQKMLNFTPDPAKMPLVDLQTLRGTLVDFQTPKAAGETNPA